MGQSSVRKADLFGSMTQYSDLLQPAFAALAKEYPNTYTDKIFASAPHKLITTVPMALCLGAATDLGQAIDNRLLVALGLMSLHISTHDDVVDEPPPSQAERAALLYAGNMAFNKGASQLAQLVDHESFNFICQQITRNHHLQQLCVEKLWDVKPKTFAAYKEAVAHDSAFLAIGLSAAVATDRHKRWPELQKACEHWGVALQLIDDITEADDDALLGYYSFPLIEGYPFKRSLQYLNDHVNRAAQALNGSWPTLQKKLASMQNAAKVLESEMNGLPQVELASAVIWRNGRCLALKRSAHNETFVGCWQLPEGKIEAGETARVAMARELREELGVEAVIGKRLGFCKTAMNARGLRVAVRRSIFTVELQDNIKLGMDHSKFDWLTPLELSRLPRVPGTGQAVYAGQ